jgi:hypothetical protein
MAADPHQASGGQIQVTDPSNRGLHANLGGHSRPRLLRAIFLLVLPLSLFAESFPEGELPDKPARKAEACPCAPAVPLPEIVGAGLLDSVIDLESLVPPKAVKVERKEGGHRVLILGDSLALCGFGKTLDSKLRSLPQVEAVSTYMACGSVPTTWLTTGPLANARTACGFWSIEGAKGERVTEVRDTFGLEKGRRPGVYTVPKLEQLAETLQPDILVMQNGTNLLSLFSDGQTILPERHDSQIRSYIKPFVRQLAQRVHSLKKVYWVAPPVTGRVSPGVQDFLFSRLRTFSSPLIEFIDSRALIPLPYKKPMPDKEHFIGKDMEIWADEIFKRIEEDIARDAYPSRSPLQTDAPEEASSPGAPGSQSAPNRATLTVRARLLAKSRPLPLEKIAPYHESMVCFLYRVERVLSGSYPEKDLLVMHPAHIGQKLQPLEKYSLNAVYKLDLVDFEGSPWEAIKRSEETGRIELLPFILKEDETRFPTGGR